MEISDTASGGGSGNLGILSFISVTVATLDRIDTPAQRRAHGRAKRGKMTLTTVNVNATEEGSCPQNVERYDSILGLELAVPQWEALITTVVLTLIILLTIIGNILVILSVFTYKPLRIVQNFFIVSLAVADLTVAILVMPLNVAYSILGKWEFGIGFCKLWLTCDVLCCTSSILNLCVIALDRYWAITDPINYAQKRTLERVLLLITGVWVLSLVISSPPLIGWNDWPSDFSRDTPCQLTTNQGYVVYSSLGSFFIPLVIMTIVYLEIYLATKRRLRDRARKVNAMAVHSTTYANNISNSNKIAAQDKSRMAAAESKDSPQIDQESLSSETNNHNHQQTQSSSSSQDNESGKSKMALMKSKNLEKRRKRENKKLEKLERLKKKEKSLLEAPCILEDSITDNNNNDEDTAVAQDSENGQERDEEEDVGCGGDGGFDGHAEPEAENGQAQAIDSNNSSSNNIEDTVANSDKQKLRVDKSKKKSMRRGPGMGGGGGSGGGFNGATGGTSVYQFIEEKQKISLSKERRAARTLGIIMGVFVVCWLPFFLMYVIVPFCSSCCPSDKLINFITWLGYINSTLNPIIYTIFNLDYRRAFKKLLGM